jgi:hypothetical protein
MKNCYYLFKNCTKIVRFFEIKKQNRIFTRATFHIMRDAGDTHARREFISNLRHL